MRVITFCAFYKYLWFLSYLAAIARSIFGHILLRFRTTLSLKRTFLILCIGWCV